MILTQSLIRPRLCFQYNIWHQWQYALCWWILWSQRVSQHLQNDLPANGAKVAFRDNSKHKLTGINVHSKWNNYRINISSYCIIKLHSHSSFPPKKDRLRNANYLGTVMAKSCTKCNLKIVREYLSKQGVYKSLWSGLIFFSMISTSFHTHSVLRLFYRISDCFPS